MTKSQISNGLDKLHIFLSDFDIFEKVDNTDLIVFGYQLNILKSDVDFRKAFLIPFFIAPLIIHFLLGSDSTAEQVSMTLWNLPQFLMGEISFTELSNIFYHYYGLGTHWSASVIYMGELYIVSKYFSDKLGWVNSFNLCMTCGVVGLSIASFEYFWNISYFFYQNQHWVLTTSMPQFKLLLQSLIFASPSIVMFLGVNWNKFKLNKGKRTYMYLFTTIFLVLLWWNYGLIFPVHRLTLEIDGLGQWTSSPMFPQTMYTVDLDLTDGVAAGYMFYAPDVTVHLINNLTKIFWTLTFIELFKIRKAENEQ